MSMIFPGMDPYLENPLFWQGVHNAMAVYLRDNLRPHLRPRYVASIEERVYLQGPDRSVAPDVWVRRSRPERVERGDGGAVAVLETDAPVEVQVPMRESREWYVEILDLSSGQRVVTVIEIVSPSNKYVGPGRDQYTTKQREVLSSDVHLVEIDLLRAGPHVLAVPEWAAREQATYDYLICVNRAREPRDRYELYPRGLRDRLPRVRIPLAGDDPDIPLNLQAVLAQTYEAGDFRDRIDYRKPCAPPLRPEDQTWAEGLIAEALRSSP